MAVPFESYGRPAPWEYCAICSFSYEAHKAGVVTEKGGTWVLCREALAERLPGEPAVADLFDAGQWEILCMSSAEAVGGYHGVAVVHRARRQLVVAHRGTQGWQDVVTDLYGIVLGDGMVEQQKAAYAFAQRAVTTAGERDIRVSDDLAAFQLSFTGHSLGGWLAQCSCALQRRQNGRFAPAVVFDAPGAASAVEQLAAAGGNMATSAVGAG